VYTPVTAAGPSYNLAGLVHGLGWWWLTFVCAGTLAAWIAAQNYSDRRNATIHALERYGAAFVREFERPLRQSWAPNAGGALGSKSHAAGAATGPGSKSHSSHAAAVLASKSATQSEVAALQSQLSIRPFGARVEILVAPAVGHLYPNLSDHRRNVEYDVRRVIAMLGDSRFVCGDLIARGPWVVIPFRFKPRGR
jgi:hypothetical protein